MKQIRIEEHSQKNTMKKFWSLLKGWATTHAKQKQWQHYRNSVGLGFVEHMRLISDDLYGLSPTKKHTTQKHSGEPISNTVKAATDRGYIKQKHTDETYSLSQGGGTVGSRRGSEYSKSFLKE